MGAMSGEAAAALAEECGSVFLLALPDDVLALVSAHLRPRDLCALALCCRGLRDAVAASDKAWLAQCRSLIGPSSPHLLPQWRSAARSYRALCRFISAVAPLLGLWVHQNPELGNVVYVLWGFLSVVGVRVIPQELGALGLDGGPLLWAPVFEILADDDGAPSYFFLHGRDHGEDCLYPGSVRSIDSSCNVLLLEVDVHSSSPCRPLQLPQSRSSSAVAESKDITFRRKLCRSDSAVVSSHSVAQTPSSSSLPFGRLAFGDRRRLLDTVAGRNRLKVPLDLAPAPLFYCSCNSSKLLADRRLKLVAMHKHNGGHIDWKAAELALGLMQQKSSANSDQINCQESCAAGKRKLFSSVAGYFRDGLKQFISRSSSPSLMSRNGNSLSGGCNSKHVQLSEFLNSGDMIGLSLRAAQMRLTTYRAWPNMHDNRYALYKLPMQVPQVGQEFAGLWGGTFGWPPGQISEDKPGKALFLLLITYEEVDGELLIIATKILEGTHYVLHPNGSAMFIAKFNEPALEAFPWETYGESLQVDVRQSYNGEGIANGYGFRYPGSKPGSLFLLESGLLAFVWKETKSILTLQRVDLQELLKTGERVPALPPISNFAYLTKSFSNVFAGFPSNSNSFSLR